MIRDFIQGNGSSPSRERGVDQALVERAQSGDKTAFDMLVRKYQHKIIRLMACYVRDPSEAQDVARDAFLKAYRALAGFRGDNAFYAWLHRIAIHTAKNHLLAAGRWPPGKDIDARDAEQYEGGDGLREFATPERRLIKDEIERTVHEVIEALPQTLRTAIMLREIEGLSYEAIARAMECPSGAVHSSIFRAREAIDQRLAPLLGG